MARFFVPLLGLFPETIVRPASSGGDADNFAVSIFGRFDIIFLKSFFEEYFSSSKFYEKDHTWKVKNWKFIFEKYSNSFSFYKI